jgi:uncharacterized peroxidase-related enzyme
MLIEPTPAEDREAVDRFIGAQEESWGYLPNYAAAFVGHPQVAQAWGALNGAIREGMDRRRYEIATIGAAQALRSTYCTAAHAKFLRDECGDEPAMRAIATGAGDEALDDVDRAVVALASQVARDAAAITERDIDALRQVGLTDNEIGDVVFAAAARAFFTKVVDGFGAQADHQLGAQFDPEVRDALVVGRPIAEG